MLWWWFGAERSACRLRCQAGAWAETRGRDGRKQAGRVSARVHLIFPLKYPTVLLASHLVANTTSLELLCSCRRTELDCCSPVTASYE